jgi:hypothetical protein
LLGNAIQEGSLPGRELLFAISQSALNFQKECINALLVSSLEELDPLSGFPAAFRVEFGLAAMGHAHFFVQSITRNTNRA